MCEIPKKYSEAMKRHMNLRAVWPPASKWELGDIITKQRGFFYKTGNITEDYSINFEQDKKKGPALKMNFNTSKIKISKIEPSVVVKDITQNLNIEASLELSFEGDYSIFMRSEPASSRTMSGKNMVSTKIANSVYQWRHTNWYVVSAVYESKAFFLLVNRKKHNKVKVSGTLGNLMKFLKGAVSPTVQFKGLTGMETVLGTNSGPVAVELFRIKKNGDIEFI